MKWSEIDEARNQRMENFGFPQKRINKFFLDFFFFNYMVKMVVKMSVCVETSVENFNLVNALTQEPCAKHCSY